MGLEVCFPVCVAVHLAVLGHEAVRPALAVSLAMAVVVVALPRAAHRGVSAHLA